MRTEDGKRSFKVALAQPEGSSYAKDIAEKYGVTYDMLISYISGANSFRIRPRIFIDSFSFLTDSLVTRLHFLSVC